MPSPSTALAIVVLGAIALTGCQPLPGRADRPIPAGGATPLPEFSAPPLIPVVPVTPTPTPPPAPVPTPAPSEPPPVVTGPPPYAHALVLPTCDNISGAAGATLLMGLGLDYVAPARVGTYGVDVPSVRSIIDARGGISCTWLDHYSKYMVTITEVTITRAQRATVIAELTAAGFGHRTYTWESYSKLLPPTVSTEQGVEMCALPLNGTDVDPDFLICVLDNRGLSLGASLQDAMDVFYDLNH